MSCISQQNATAGEHEWRPLKDMPDKFEHCVRCGLVRIKLMPPINWLQDGNVWHAYRDGQKIGLTICVYLYGTFAAHRDDRQSAYFNTFAEAVQAALDL